MSIPVCIRPHRKPNGLVTGPLTGQMSPAADGIPSPGGEYEPLEALIRAASVALAWARPAASCRNSRLLSLIWIRLSRRLLRARASQALDRDGVLALEPEEAGCLDPVELGQAVELLHVQREVVLDRCEPHGDVSDLARELAQLSVHRVELGRECASAALGPGDLGLDVAQARVDRLFPAVVVAAGPGRKRFQPAPREQ